ncbi:hypothetical protein NBT05_07070 [Aquimarina sp. ERC-38]|uniref:hypothetical protein n=1 Tax=Aquimarina sp. ERC-38 TaxID=2949996 RepID=UPI002246718A|nr:hypothetical protein [Aquimarina sp. ERC-38]UZO82229.1 hypothetical protein NBT05_07070 [Aquimarina sp. ERC-38]
MNAQKTALNDYLKTAVLLFEDDFNRLEIKDSVNYLNKEWRPNLSSTNVKQSAIVQNRLYLEVSADANHGASVARTVPFDDGILQVDFRMLDKGFNKKRGFHINFNDEDATEFVHYGHVCQVSITPTRVQLVDQFTGVHRNDVWALIKSGSAEKERKGREMVKDKYCKYPINLELEEWGTLTLLFIKDELSVFINEKLIACKKSPGFDHKFKKETVLALWNAAVEFDNFKIWSLDK